MEKDLGSFIAVLFNSLEKTRDMMTMRIVQMIILLTKELIKKGVLDMYLYQIFSIPSANQKRIISKYFSTDQKNADW